MWMYNMETRNQGEHQSCVHYFEVLCYLGALTLYYPLKLGVNGRTQKAMWNIQDYKENFSVSEVYHFKYSGRRKAGISLGLVEVNPVRMII